MGEQDWQNAVRRWQGKDGRLRLEGWSRYRRIVIHRARIGAEVNCGSALPKGDEARLTRFLA
jgi:hypothetical protein